MHDFLDFCPLFDGAWMYRCVVHVLATSDLVSLLINQTSCNLLQEKFAAVACNYILIHLQVDILWAV